MRTVKDLTVEEFKALVGEAVEEKLREVLPELRIGVTLGRDVQANLGGRSQKSEDADEPELPRRKEMEW